MVSLPTRFQPSQEGVGPRSGATTAATLTAVAPTKLSSSHRLPAWLEIAKPRLIPLLLATTVGGMALSSAWPLDPGRFLATLVGGSLAAAAAGILNCLWEEQLDGRMLRTSRRALPSGRLASSRAFAIAVLLTGIATVLLTFAVNPLAASLSLLGLCSYVLLYTAILKPLTTQNIVIGGVAGAIPPLVGAAAASGTPGWGGWWLFWLVMAWTPAHFWALALLLREDYRSVGIPMLPVVHGSIVTAKAIGRYSWITVILSLLGVFALPSGGWFFGVMVLPLNGRLLQLSHRLSLDPEDPDRARSLFRWSILYLFAICLLLVLSRLPAASGPLPSELFAHVMGLQP